MDSRRGRLAACVLASAVALGAFVGTARAAGVEAASLSQEMRVSFAWQIALERAGFSPGLVDGRPGAKTELATREFQKARGLAVTGKLDGPTAQVLLDPPVSLLGTYTVTGADVAMVTGVPKDWNEKAGMKFLGYGAVAEAVCERYHTSRKCLEGLNPGVNFDKLKAGDELSVPAIVEPENLPSVGRLEINLAEKAIRAYDRSDREIALFHCSIAKDVEKRPTGSAKVVGVTQNPAYSFDPKMWPDVKNVTKKLLIPPGPRNPVGMCWIGLSLTGYGIHGTPNPEMIGKTGSHGCFRLANWDAVRLGRITTAGVPVKFINTAPATITAAAAAPGKSENLLCGTSAVMQREVAQAPKETPALKNTSWDELLMGTTTPPTEPTVVQDVARAE